MDGPYDLWLALPHIWCQKKDNTSDKTLEKPCASLTDHNTFCLPTATVSEGLPSGSPQGSLPPLRCLDTVSAPTFESPQAGWSGTVPTSGSLGSAPWCEPLAAATGNRASEVVSGSPRAQTSPGNETAWKAGVQSQGWRAPLEWQHLVQKIGSPRPLLLVAAGLGPAPVRRASSGLSKSLWDEIVSGEDQVFTELLTETQVR